MITSFHNSPDPNPRPISTTISSLVCMSILPTLKSDSECYTEATPSLYGSGEDSDAEQDIGIEQVEEQDAGVKQVQEQDSRVVQEQVQGRAVEEEVQNLTVQRMLPPILFRRGGLRSQIILGEEIL